MNDSVGLSTDRPRLCGRPGVGTRVHTCVGDGVRTGVDTFFFYSHDVDVVIVEVYFQFSPVV